MCCAFLVMGLQRGNVDAHPTLRCSHITYLPILSIYQVNGKAGDQSHAPTQQPLRCNLRRTGEVAWIHVFLRDLPVGHKPTGRCSASKQMAQIFATSQVLQANVEHTFLLYCAAFQQTNRVFSFWLADPMAYLSLAARQE